MLKEFKRIDDGMEKTERKAETDRLEELMVAQQMKLKEAGLPVIVLVEGWSSAGKGGLINRLIAELDPRFATVFCSDSATKEADRYPFLNPYFNAIPEKGKLLFMDGGWMEAAVRSHMKREVTDAEHQRRIVSVNTFERQLRDNGYLVIKLFVHISKKTQGERMEALRSSRNTEWRVTEADLWQHREYDGFRQEYDSFMEQTGVTEPWYVLDGKNEKKLFYDALSVITYRIDRQLDDGVYVGTPTEKQFPMSEPVRLSDADLTASLTDEEYKEELKKYQKRLAELHNVIYRRRIPVVIAFEGWDAAGKGGSIRRLAKPLDPRGFIVFPIASPEPHEKARHYLWRFTTRLPRSGHVAIFDRTWYGRVMVERIEGFCSENDWKRAYGEMNEFERELTDEGAVVLKFWLQIDSDTQLARFTDRQNTPEKQWKITDEDWRNRDKWPQYEQAVSEMLEKTSTSYAPWHIVESVDKKYARIKVLRIVTEALEDAIEKNKL